MEIKKGSIAIEVQGNDGAWTRTAERQDIITNHVAEYYQSIVNCCAASPDVLAPATDSIVPIAVGLYNDPTPTDPSTAARERGELIGWAALSYDYHSNNQALQGSRVVPQFTVEDMGDGYTKHTVVAEFGTVHALGTINKLRLYGSELRRYAVGGTAGITDYTRLTKAAPYSPRSDVSVGVATRTCKYGFGSDKYFVHSADNDANRKFARQHCQVNGEYFVQIVDYDKTKGEAIFEVSKLGAISLGFVATYDQEVVGTFRIKDTTARLFSHTTTYLDVDGNVSFVSVAANGTLHVKHITKASGYTVPENQIITWPWVDGIHRPYGSGQIKVVDDATYYYYIVGGMYVHNSTQTLNIVRVAKADPTDVSLQSHRTAYNAYSFWFKYVFFSPDQHELFLAVDSEVTNGVASQYPIISIVLNDEWVTTKEAAIAHTGTTRYRQTGVTNYSRSAGTAYTSYYSSYNYDKHFATRNMHGHVADGGLFVYDFGFCNTRKTFVGITSNRTLVFTPMMYCGEELILAESKIPDYIKTDEQSVRIIFEYVVKTTFAPPTPPVE